MIGDSLLPLKKACYATLTANSTFMGLVTGLFDQQAPTNQPFNYVETGVATMLPDNTMGKGGRECTITYDIWTQVNTGSADALTILDVLLKALVETTITLSTTPAQACTYVDLDNYSDQIESSGAIPAYHGIARLLFRTQEI